MNEIQTGEICWTELATANVKAAKDFYGKVFGWEFSEREMGDMTYTMIKSNDKDLGGIWQIPKDKQNHMPAHWMSYILVDNIKEAVEKAKKNGASIIKPVADAGGMGQMAIIADPTGAHIALWQPANK